jgi:hypothetical protein
MGSSAFPDESTKALEPALDDLFLGGIYIVTKRREAQSIVTRRVYMLLEISEPLLLRTPQKEENHKVL